MDVVVVESPAKAKTIHKYLGGKYRILASFGHVRDLPPKEGSVLPDDDFRMIWEIMDKAKKNVREIASMVRGAGTLYLATDPDREGEAISWHLIAALNEAKVMNGVAVKRVVFHEITKEAVLAAFSSARTIDENLVDAYLARRALDYLVGFTLSPVLWRKLPGSRSAGRVQSVALRMICDREKDIELFKPKEYWLVDAMLQTEKNERFAARLVHYQGKKLDKFALNKDSAGEAQKHIEQATWHVAQVTAKEERRHPRPPFTTSTLQQEASRKLGFSAKQTMTLAQKLYDGSALQGQSSGGLITYMRTDSQALSQQAVRGLRTLIGKAYGEAYLPPQPNVYKGRVKNAQEAHEAIRPTDVARDPKSLRGFLDSESHQLYDLIWKRTLASQMKAAVFERIKADMSDGKNDAQVTMLRANGSRVVFDGFLSIYQEGVDEKSDSSADISADMDMDDMPLPALTQGQKVAVDKADASQHFTKPPPRFTEASLVKELESHGIGRPSTYAAIISVLQERGYVRLDKRRFIADTKGRIVVVFLHRFFRRYIQNDFTASLEDQLDDIARGELSWKKALEEFWRDFIKTIEQANALSTREVIDLLNESLEHFLFGDKENARLCPQCGEGTLGMKFSRYGPFIGCSRYPDCRYTRAFGAHGDAAAAEGAMRHNQVLGTHPQLGVPISLRDGPYGPYLQLDEETKGKPKRASLNRTGYTPDTVTLAVAVGLLALPRVVGKHPQSGEDMIVSNGPYGPYVRHQNLFASLQEGDDLLAIGDNRAVELLTLAEEKRKARIMVTLGTHPDDGQTVTIEKSRFGPCLVHGRTKVYLGKRPFEDMTMDEAVGLIEEKKKKAAEKKTTKKTTKRAKKTVAKSAKKSTS
ncbi:MAG: type I DNA topoisomerase [Alphaproteobacteria bacterium GM202ARS2]|nr:type I DNA topoisomerase [Alphaproteobacteria bacterium GM202ARS2]